MPTTVKNPVNDVCEYWQKIMSAHIGQNNVSVEPTSTIANDKNEYARIAMLGNPTRERDLEGNELATSITFQCELYAGGLKSLSRVYQLDEISHQIMTDMGFTRSYTRLTNNADERLKRVVSRYRIQEYTGILLNQIEK